MKIAVLGSGGWGTALSIVLCDNGHDVTLWSHNPAKAAEMAEKRLRWFPRSRKWQKSVCGGFRGRGNGPEQIDN